MPNDCCTLDNLKVEAREGDKIYVYTVCVSCGVTHGQRVLFSNIYSVLKRKPDRKVLLDLYDLIHKFGNQWWNRVDLIRFINPDLPVKSASRRLSRMDIFCEKWGIEIQKKTAREIEGARSLRVHYRKFTDASKRRVDQLLGPVVSEFELPEQDTLRQTLGSSSRILQENPM